MENSQLSCFHQNCALLSGTVSLIHPLGEQDDYYENKPGVYKVSWLDIAECKWPQPPKSCDVCKRHGKKPY